MSVPVADIQPSRSQSARDPRQSSHRDFGHRGYRKDIDGLRCLAVIAVVLFHYDLFDLPGGFSGVDVFFVISGFLITGNIVDDLRHNRFSYVGFYERRVRRLFPALTVVVIAALAASWIILLPDDFWRFARSLVSAELYASNFVFWMEEDYFHGPSELKPLLHTWSLAVEEQFYLLIPPILVLLHRFCPHHLLRAVALLGVASFVFCEFLLRLDASAAFYLLPARMWELLIGSTVALASSAALSSRHVREPLAVLGMSAIVASFVLLDKNVVFPGLTAGIACGGTAIVIATAIGATTSVSRALSMPLFVWIGRRSYSLYLWHWPTLVLAQYLMLAPLGTFQRILLLGLSVAASDLSYRYVEQPFRSGRLLSRRQLFTISAAGSILLVVIGVAIWRAAGVPSRFPLFAQAPNVDIEAKDRRARVCMLEPDQEAHAAWSSETCRLTDGAGAPVLVWGDSHAAHLRHGIEALSAQIDRPVFLLASSACPPILDIDVPARPHCRTNNQFALDIIRQNAITTVIIAANWDYAANHNKAPLKAVTGTLELLRAQNVDVWVVGQLPIYALQNPQYLYYRLQSAGYSLPTYAIPPRNGTKIQEILKAVTPSDRLLDVYNVFCSEGRCAVFRDRELMVIDSAHLSPAGSTFIVRWMIAKGVFRDHDPEHP